MKHDYALWKFKASHIESFLNFIEPHSAENMENYFIQAFIWSQSPEGFNWWADELKKSKDTGYITKKARQKFEYYLNDHNGPRELSNEENLQKEVDKLTQELLNTKSELEYAMIQISDLNDALQDADEPTFNQKLEI